MVGPLAPRPRWHQQVLAVLVSLFLTFAPGLPLLANPSGEEVTAGAAKFLREGANLTINVDDKSIIQWQDFSIQSGELTHFIQPGVDASVLNRVVGQDMSAIYGTLQANGQVYLVNPNGVMIGEGGIVNAGGFVASTLDIADSVYLGNGDLSFTGDSAATVTNLGTLSASGGNVYLIARQVANAGTILAPDGTVGMYAGQDVILADTGSGRSGAVRLATKEAVDGTAVDNSGLISAAQVELEAAAGNLYSLAVSNSGVIEATGTSTRNGVVYLLGDGGSVTQIGTLRANNADSSGGTLSVDGGFVSLGGLMSVDGLTQGGSITVRADTLSLADRISAVSSEGSGGSIMLFAYTRTLETASSTVDASGAQGGRIAVDGGLSFTSSGNYLARGQQGDGGSIDLTANDLRLLSAQVDASGSAAGGQIRVGGELQGGAHLTEGDELRNASYVSSTSGTRLYARGGESSGQGDGGRVILWADHGGTILGEIDARPGLDNGLGGFAEVSAGTSLRQRASIETGRLGRNGTVLLDPKNVLIAEEDAGPTQYGIVLGAGQLPKVGSHEVVSEQHSVEQNDQFGAGLALDGNRLAVGAPFDGQLETGQPGGAVYLFTFADESFNGAQLEGVIGRDYHGGKNIAVEDLTDFAGFGGSLDLDGKHLAVGEVPHGLNGNSPVDGVVRLFAFDNEQFEGGTQVRAIGQNVSGPSDIVVSSLESDDRFGSSVALDGLNLAVGASGDDGFNNVDSNTGAVYLFSFSDERFEGPSMEGVIGRGYTGSKHVDMATLQTDDAFGHSVSLDGQQLAASALRDRTAAVAEGHDTLNNGDVSAVYLFSFTDDQFSGGTHEGTIGLGYNGAKDADLSIAGIDFSYDAGARVSLDANRLAIGAPNASSATNPSTNPVDTYGGVYLFSFTDDRFSNPTLEATIGKDYTGAKDIDMAAELDERHDLFGYDVSLDGNRLAVGAIQDDGDGGSDSTSAGAVYIFTFSDANFGGGELAARMQRDATGARDLDIADMTLHYERETVTHGLDANDFFGTSVALDDNRLAIGAPGNDGPDNTRTETGGVYLYTFEDSDFNGGRLQGLIGSGYVGGKNVDVDAIETIDAFGTTVDLEGNRLVVSATQDDGAGLHDTNGGIGAVYAFSFSDREFNNGEHIATIGKGYTGGKNLDVTDVVAGDAFGDSLSLDGQRLAIGAPGQSGSGGETATGAVYLYTFTDENFSGGQQVAVLGKGKTGGLNLDVSNLEAIDQFGVGVALDGNRLAVGAGADAGADNNSTQAGAVYLFSFADENFNGGQQEAIVGKGYTGGKNVDVASLDGGNFFDNGDGFGTGVDMEGTRLIVGAPGDRGPDNEAFFGSFFTSGAGGVYLFNFDDEAYNGGRLAGVIGSGYTGVRDVDVSDVIDGADGFGFSVSLDDNQLIVGASSDAGPENNMPNHGAVHLFTFANEAFLDARQAGTIGSNYTEGASLDPGVVELDAARAPSLLDVSLEADALSELPEYKRILDDDNRTLHRTEQYGSAVALEDRLMAVGERLDDGASPDLDDPNFSEQNFGAVYLYSYGDDDFGGARLEGVIGKGYAGGKNLDIDRLDLDDGFGSSLSLDNRRLAVGAPEDDGAGNQYENTGAVYAFSFGEADFGDGRLDQIIGKGYQEAGQIDLGTLDEHDQFGSAVSLDGKRLVVGSPGDDGQGNSQLNTGAVYQLAFSNEQFGDGRLAGIVGRDYEGGFNHDLDTLSDGDRFGSAVALDDKRLAVGAPRDNGQLAESPVDNEGAVHLFTYTDLSFGGIEQAARIGSGYESGNDFNLEALEGRDLLAGKLAGDEFGSAVSLDGNRLAVGAHWDDGADNSRTRSGAIYLFTFTEEDFGGLAHEGTIGAGYNGTKDIDLGAAAEDYSELGSSLALDGDRLVSGAPFADTRYVQGGQEVVEQDTGRLHQFHFDDAFFGGGARVGQVDPINVLPEEDFPTSGPDAGDRFGEAVALSGNLLAVGSAGADGADNARSDSGEVRLYRFADSNLTAPRLEGIIGHGYEGGKNLSLDLDAVDGFGSALALDGQRLAVGAPGDDGQGAANAESAGAVYLFTFSDNAFGGGEQKGVAGLKDNPADELAITDLEAGDGFGSSLALSGEQLAVGAPGDDGSGNLNPDSGAIYLLEFADDSLENGQLAGRAGAGYAGVGDRDLGALLDTQDGFGEAVGFEGERLAVGAPGDDGFGNGVQDAGAVHLLDLGESGLSDAALAGSIGAAYEGEGDLALDGLQAGDRLGSALALDDARLAMGATGDPGTSEALPNAGAVYLVDLEGSRLGRPVLRSTYGGGRNGSHDLAPANLNAEDGFGSALALDGDRLVIGAPGDDGADNSSADAGRLFFVDVGEPKSAEGTFVDNSHLLNQRLENGDFFGRSVALEGQALAIGADSADGQYNLVNESGEVLLYTFADDAFRSPSLQGIIGAGYEGGKNVNVDLGQGDNFGAGLSLDGMRLVVGAPGDDGLGNTQANAGAVYLFDFEDESWNRGRQQALLGAGYTAGKNVDVQPSGSRFGSSVALSGNSLAVGVPFDAGADGSQTSAPGAVYLFTFEDPLFAGGQEVGHIGHGYTGSRDLDLSTPLGDLDNFGASVALDGRNLAVGAPSDDGLGNSVGAAGAVYLFRFDDTAFRGGQQEGVIGAGYNGIDDFNLAGLEASDQFGSSLDLDGTTLAVGAKGDDGAGNNAFESGAVYLFEFANDELFSPNTRLVLGNGYASGTDLAVEDLSSQQSFGAGVALDDNRLVVGSEQGGGFTDSGLVHFFDLGNEPYPGSSVSSNVTLRPSDLAVLLASSQDVIIQAENDIRLADPLIIKAGGFGSALTLQAGRSVLLDDDIATDNGALNIVANQAAVGGETLQQRDAGEALIRMAPGTRIDLGSGTFDAQQHSGGALNPGEAGDIQLSDIATTGDVRVRSDNPTAIRSEGEVSGSEIAFEAPEGSIIHSGSLSARENADTGGRIRLNGSFVSLGGAVRADGAAQGGEVDVDADTLALADEISAASEHGRGGSIDLDADVQALVTSSAQVDASGAEGGDIALDGGLALTNSGDFKAAGTEGDGGQIDMTADDVSLLSATLDATGGEDGGRIRVGGEARQPSDDPPGDALRPANTLAVSEGSMLDAGGGRGAAGEGDGGEVVLRAEEEAAVLGEIDARPGENGGLGGQAEIGAGEDLRSRAEVATGRPDRPGQVLIDEKNVNIGDDEAGVMQAEMVLGSVSEDPDEDSLNIGDYFGTSVSLDGRNLAIGAIGDDGIADGSEDTGAVYLYRFDDLDFGGAKLEAILGRGYTGGKNIDVADLEDGDAFGSAVSLDGSRLVVGASGTDGAATDSGAAYLISFEDEALGNGLIEGVIGSGRHYENDIDLGALATEGLNFGEGVALEDKRLVVGAPGAAGDTGAAHLFEFETLSFESGRSVGTVGLGTSGESSVELTGVLEVGDRFGSDVALEGDRLVVGATGDDGALPGGTDLNFGAAHLLQFDGESFSGGRHTGTIGFQYKNSGDVTVAALDPRDELGSSVALDGRVVVVGAWQDRGNPNDDKQSGAVRLFAFDENFQEGQQVGKLGRGYRRDGEHAVNRLESVRIGNELGDRFGSGVTIDGDRLIVGASHTDHVRNETKDGGAVYLFELGGDILDEGSSTLRPEDLNELAAEEQGVRVLADNDLTVEDAVELTGADPDSELKLEAGRNVRLEDDLSKDRGRLLVAANSGANAGVDPERREAGAGGIDALEGTGIDAGEGALEVALRDGEGLADDASAGDVSLQDLASDESVSVNNDNPTDIRTQGAIQAPSVALSASEGGIEHEGSIEAIEADGSGGTVDIDGEDVSLGGSIAADGTTGDGGEVEVDAENLSLASEISASSEDGKGGSVDLEAEDSIEETASSRIAASGTEGGEIQLDGGESLLSSGTHEARGSEGDGGQIGVTADDVRLLSATLDASGAENGGSVDVGGNPEGVAVDPVTGQPLDPEELRPARSVGTTNGTQLLARGGEGAAASGDGGQVRVRAAEEGTILGNIDARPGELAGQGGSTEVAAGETLQSRSSIATGRVGRPGQVFLDDKNVVIAEEDVPTTQFDLVLGASRDGDLDALDESRRFGTSVSLDGNRLAVGAFEPGDTHRGEVYLFSFADRKFAQPRLEGIMGDGRTGGKNVDVSLENGAQFGIDLSLDGNRLAVGSIGDDGAESGNNTGSVYLYSFEDELFANATLEGRIGEGYDGQKDLNLDLDDFDHFGRAVSLDGLGLAVGAPGDDGHEDQLYNSGAVHLINFGDETFGGAQRVGLIGVGYEGANDVDVSSSILLNDQFATSVSLDGERLAAGAIGNDGAGSRFKKDAGAAYLFEFDNPSLAGGDLVSSIGDGYEGPGDLDLTLDAFEEFGSSVALEGDVLVIGTQRDAGAGSLPGRRNLGSVAIIDLGPGPQVDPELRGVLGRDYDGLNDHSIGALESGDFFGFSASLNEGRLAVGAPGDDGSDNGSHSGTDLGVVHLFKLGTPPAREASFRPEDLAQLLGSPQNIVISADNDLAVNDAVQALNTAPGSDLTLSAGRSLQLNDDLDLNVDSLSLLANTPSGSSTPGREEGAGALTMAPGTELNAGSGDLDLRLFDHGEAPAGELVLGGVSSAGAVQVSNQGDGPVVLDGRVEADTLQVAAEGDIAVGGPVDISGNAIELNTSDNGSVQIAGDLNVNSGGADIAIRGGRLEIDAPIIAEGSNLDLQGGQGGIAINEPIDTGSGALVLGSQGTVNQQAPIRTEQLFVEDAGGSFDLFHPDNRIDRVDGADDSIFFRPNAEGGPNAPFDPFVEEDIELLFTEQFEFSGPTLFDASGNALEGPPEALISDFFQGRFANADLVFDAAVDNLSPSEAFLLRQPDTDSVLLFVQDEASGGSALSDPASGQVRLVLPDVTGSDRIVDAREEIINETSFPDFAEDIADDFSADLPFASEFSSAARSPTPLFAGALTTELVADNPEVFLPSEGELGFGEPVGNLSSGILAPRFTRVRGPARSSTVTPSTSAVPVTTTGTGSVGSTVPTAEGATAVPTTESATEGSVPNPVESAAEPTAEPAIGVDEEEEGEGEAVSEEPSLPLLSTTG